MRRLEEEDDEFAPRPCPVERPASDTFALTAASSGRGLIRSADMAPHAQDHGIRGWLADEWVGGDRRPKLGDGLDGSSYKGPGILFLQGWPTWMPEESRMSHMSHAAERLLTNER